MPKRTTRVADLSDGLCVDDPPGKTHTLMVDEGVFTKIDMCRRHVEAVGLGTE